MSSIDTRSPFFPRSRTAQAEAAQKKAEAEAIKNAKAERANEMRNRTSQDARVSIPEGVKDFSRIKKAANEAPERNNADKIANLKAQIQAGTYKVDYDAVADKIMESEF